MRKFGKVLAAAMSAMLVFSCALIPSYGKVVSAAEKTASEQYVDAMGTGINLGNSFDAFDRVNHLEIDDETAWGNPVITEEYIDALKAKGFNSIRIPFTSFTRTDANYQINDGFLDRYEEVVNYALDAGFYVMINLHHDSSEWLRYWDGDKTSDEYLRFIALWTQLADRFKDYGDHVMFESANEVYFTTATTDAQQNEMVGEINQAFYDVVRNSGGNNATRMLVLPTSYTNHGLVYGNYLANFIKNLNDPNVIATVHYYITSLYAFTCNIGISEFDEVHWNTTARNEIDTFYDCLEQAFVDNGIGVVIGEYGLFNMGAPGSLETGEVAKFLEYMNYKANELGICTMLWDPGSTIDRDTCEFINSTWGDIVESSMTERSSYATGLDELFVTNRTAADNISIPLTLNGNTLTAIYNGSTKLVQGKDYNYSGGTVTLLGSYISKLMKGEYGVKADLRFAFSAGSDWHEYINYEGTAVMESINTAIRTDDGFMARYDTDGTPTYPTTLIPIDYNGKKIRRITSLDASGNPKSGNTWASNYMQYGGEFMVNYEDNLLGLTNWYNSAIPDGTYTLVIDFYDDTTVKYSLTKANGNVTGYQITDSNVDYSLSITNDWSDGCQGSLTITNTTGKDFTTGWTLSLDFDRVLTDVYGATLVSSQNNHYVISNPSWDTTLAAGETITINFLAGRGNSSAVVSNCVLQ